MFYGFLHKGIIPTNKKKKINLVFIHHIRALLHHNWIFLYFLLENVHIVKDNIIGIFCLE